MRISFLFFTGAHSTTLKVLPISEFGAMHTSGQISSITA